MGNRAHVIFTDAAGKDISPAVYLHWNGGPESVYAFLDEMERRHCRSDTSYAPARFCHVVGDFFDQDEAGSSSLGVTNGPKSITPKNLIPYDHGDNGIYVVSWNDGKRHVRRFVSTYGPEGKDGPRELAPDQVESERKAAYANPYNTDPENPDKTIPAIFLKLRPKIAKYG